MIQFKQLKRNVGFLIYVSQIYACMVLYFKRIYLTLNSWQHDWDKTGWKILKQKQDDAELHHGLPPQIEDPSEVLVCACHLNVVYLVGHTSERGFGCCSCFQGSAVIKVIFGV